MGESGVTGEGLRGGLTKLISGAVAAGLTALVAVVVAYPPVRHGVIDPVCGVDALAPACESLDLISDETKAAAARAATLAQLEGRWSFDACRTIGVYRVEGDRIVALWPGFESEGRILSVSGEAVRTVDPNGVETVMQVSPEHLTVSNGASDARVLERCP